VAPSNIKGGGVGQLGPCFGEVSITLAFPSRAHLWNGPCTEPQCCGIYLDDGKKLNPALVVQILFLKTIARHNGT
jgi:hypothetical protein